MTTPFPDLLGYGATHRDVSSFYMDTINEVSRRMDYKQCVIEIQKENWEYGEAGDEFLFYIGDAHQRLGIKDYFEEEQHSYQKIVYLENFIQCHVSHDREQWINVGGLDITGVNITTQGFRKTSNYPLRLMNYAIYHDPYLTIQNFPENYKIELYNSDDVKVNERLFTLNEDVEIYLDRPLNDAYVKVYDTDNNLVFTSDRMDFKYGDAFAMLEFELEAIYKGRILPDEEITQMDTGTWSELVILKNTSDIQTYNNLTVGTVVESDDTVQLSLDNINFSDTVPIVELDPLSEINIYVQIRKADTTNTFITRNFLFKVY